MTPKSGPTDIRDRAEAVNEPFDTDEEPLLAKAVRAKKLAAEGAIPGAEASDSDVDDDELRKACDDFAAKNDTFSLGSIPGVSLPPASSSKELPALERALLPVGAYKPFKRPRKSGRM